MISEKVMGGSNQGGLFFAKDQDSDNRRCEVPKCCLSVVVIHPPTGAHGRYLHLHAKAYVRGGAVTHLKSRFFRPYNPFPIYSEVCCDHEMMKASAEVEVLS
jgi:hypothetical protein